MVKPTLTGNYRIWADPAQQAKMAERKLQLEAEFAG
jgi:hypothetical protein